MQMLEFIEELAKKICEIELCVSNLSDKSHAGQFFDEFKTLDPP